jgi:hypothetical protein
MPVYLVFDVESVGLHGEGFAFGYVVVNAEGERLEEGRHSCSLRDAKGDAEGRDWVRKNVPLDDFPEDCFMPPMLRACFWEIWKAWQGSGAVLVADCAWPVEARFLIACVDDDASRTWGGPYPLHELASFMVAAGMDPHATYDRLPDEPQHDPLGDARQSARLLVTALSKVGAA